MTKEFSCKRLTRIQFPWQSTCVWLALLKKRAGILQFPAVVPECILIFLAAYSLLLDNWSLNYRPFLLLDWMLWWIEKSYCLQQHILTEVFFFSPNQTIGSFTTLLLCCGAKESESWRATFGSFFTLQLLPAKTYMRMGCAIFFEKKLQNKWLNSGGETQIIFFRKFKKISDIEKETLAYVWPATHTSFSCLSIQLLPRIRVPSKVKNTRL